MVKGFAACDFVAGVRIDIRVFCFFDWQFGGCKTGRAADDQRLATQESDIKKARELVKKEKKNDDKTRRLCVRAQKIFKLKRTRPFNLSAGSNYSYKAFGKKRVNIARLTTLTRFNLTYTPRPYKQSKLPVRINYE